MIDARRVEASGDYQLFLYSSAYLVVLGTTYAILPMPTTGFFPLSADIRGLAYVASGCALLWTALDGLRPRTAVASVVAAALLMAATAVDFASRGAPGVALAHAAHAAALAARVPATWMHRFEALDLDRASVLGLVLGAAQVFTGAQGALAPATMPDIPLLALTGRGVGILYFSTGLAVVVLSLRPAAAPRLRKAAHVAAAGAMIAVQIGLAAALGPAVIGTWAASTLRIGVTLALPVVESRVSPARRTLRTRFAAAFGTLALLGALVTAVVGAGLDVDGTRPGAASRRVVAFWTVLAVGAVGYAAGGWLASTWSRAMRAALDQSLAEGEDIPDEIRDVLSTVRGRAAQVATLERRLSDRDDRLGGIGHDLRNPLGVIVTAATILEAKADDQVRVRQVARVVRANAGRMRGMVENLVESVRIDSAQARPHNPSRINFGEVLRDVASHFAYSSQGTRLSFEPSDVDVLAEVPDLERITTNLIENALKYSPEGQPVLVSITTDGQFARLRVTDHGRGVPRHERERIFERYYRAGSPARTGFGLGLFVSRHLATANGGDLWVEDTPGGGATFVLQLPVAASAAGSPVGAASFEAGVVR